MKMTRRTALAGALATLMTGAMPAARAAATRRLFVGTYTTGRGLLGGVSFSKGLYTLELDTTTGALSKPVLAAEAEDPTNLIAHPNGRALYVAHGFGTRFDGMNRLSAYAIVDSKLQLLNSLPSGGFTPTHGAIDSTGQVLILTNYRSDNVVVFRLLADGSLVERTALLGKPAGTAAWQDASGWRKPHIAVLSRNERFAITAEINTDRCLVYRFDAAAGTISPAGEAMTPAGAGPRHLAFHPGYRFLYSSNERGSSVTAFRWDEDSGKLNAMQTVSSLPQGFDEKNEPSHLAVHPSGRFLYLANRGHGSLAVFAINPSTGHLEPRGHVPLGATSSWCFVIDPTGQWLVAANMSGDNIVSFRVDSQTGLLSVASDPVVVGTPTCLVMI